MIRLSSTASACFPAIQALVATSVSDHDTSAVVTHGCIFGLEGYGRDVLVVGADGHRFTGGSDFGLFQHFDQFSFVGFAKV